MNLLAIDTATRMISLALHNGEQIIAETSWQTAHHHTVELAPALHAMLARAGVSPALLDAIAVALGPGSFTGLRIGMSVAKGFALASDPRPALVGIPTLDIVAGGQPHICERLCAVAQAGRGRVSAGFYRGDGERWMPEGEAFIARWADVIARFEGKTLVAGEIGPAGRAALAGLDPGVIVASPAANLRRAGVLADLALARLVLGDTDDPATLAPIYLHEPGEGAA